MIQRIQSVFLFLVVVLVVLAIVQPMYYFTVNVNFPEGQTATSSIGLTQQVAASDGTTEIVHDNYKIMALSLIGIIALITIFMFKKRDLQMRLLRINIIATLLFAVGMAYFIYNFTNSLDINEMTYSPTGILVIVGILVLNILAYGFIKKDDNLVKSADRFR